jgi:SAM-dependent methyltransferase
MADGTVEFGRGAVPEHADGRLDGQAFHRNHAAIWPVVEAFLKSKAGDVLEIGSGTGQHAVQFAGKLPAIVWWPTDLNNSHLRSIAAWRAHSKLANVQTPVLLDASESDWRLAELGLPSEFVAMFCANVIHIAPWRVAEGLVAGAARYLREDGRLVLYGPFKRDGHHTAISNAVFDTSLRSQDPQWGIRDVADVTHLAESEGFRLARTFEMPANNLILMFERAGAPSV